MTDTVEWVFMQRLSSSVYPDGVVPFSTLLAEADRWATLKAAQLGATVVRQTFEAEGGLAVLRLQFRDGVE